VKSNKLQFFALLIIILSGCRKDEEVDIDFRYEYFPVEVGHWVIYNVDSVTYNNFDGSVDTSTFEIKEIIESTFIENEGRTSYRIERYRRDNDTCPWILKDVWSADLTTTRAERVEENLRFLKLIFPPKVGKLWKGNVYINAQDDLAFYNDWDYEYTEVDTGKTIYWYTPDSIRIRNTFLTTLTVLQVDREDLLEKVYGEEIYAKDVGLVYKKLVHLKTQKISSAPWYEKAEKGFILTMNVVDYK